MRIQGRIKYTKDQCFRNRIIDKHNPPVSVLLIPWKVGLGLESKTEQLQHFKELEEDYRDRATIIPDRDFHAFQHLYLCVAKRTKVQTTPDGVDSTT